jgi:hypothetical protein
LPRPVELALTFVHAVDRLEACCTRAEGLRVARRLSVTDVELIYESAFLNAVSRFEGLLSELLEEFVCGKHKARNGHFSMVSVRSRETYRTLVRGGREYVDLLPISNCIDVAERFLNAGKPFSTLDDNSRRILGQAHLIRNAIAHRSDTAILKFRNKVTGVELLPPQRRFPGALLRRTFRAHPVQSWNSLYLSTLRGVGSGLASAW